MGMTKLGALSLMLSTYPSGRSSLGWTRASASSKRSFWVAICSHQLSDSMRCSASLLRMVAKSPWAMCMRELGSFGSSWRPTTAVDGESGWAIGGGLPLGEATEGLLDASDISYPWNTQYWSRQKQECRRMWRWGSLLRYR